MVKGTALVPPTNVKFHPKMEKDLQARGRVYKRAYTRIGRIHKEIASNSFPTAARLAKICEANIRTVKRDLYVLRYELNAPLKNDRRKKGYYYADPGWTIPPVRLTEGDLLAFFIADNALRLTGQTPEALMLKKSLSKLISLLPEEVSVNSAAFAENLSFRQQPFETSDPGILKELAKCSTNQTTVEFDYYAPSRQGSERRRVDPYLIHNEGGDWYAVSYDHNRNAMRDFHIGRITNLKTTNKGFEIRKELWNKEEYLAKGFNMMRGGRMTSVEIIFDAYQSQWIRKRGPFHPDEQKEDLPDGGLRLSFRIGEGGLDAVARFCLQYAGNCIAEKPAKLREIIRERLEKAIKQHSQSYEK